MSQITSGIRSVLSMPIIYSTFQSIMGAKKIQLLICDDCILTHSVKRVLDIGCGTADILEVLPLDIQYIGFDASESYIEYARKKYSQRNATFIASLVNDTELENFESFDLVIASGILHHLGDEEAVKLFKIAKASLSEKGRLFTIDPCFVEHQSMISKWLVSSDRGQDVRDVNQYRVLANNVFDNVELYHRNDLLRVPYDHAIMICK